MSRQWVILTSILSMNLSAVGLIPNSSASEPAKTPEQRVQNAIEMLERVPSGRATIELALRTWKLESAQDLSRKVKPGLTSRTDAVLTRHYNPETGDETREREITVYVRQDQSLDSMVLDIAHEMIHATSRPSWDPYDADLTPGRYIKSAIEGEGGEIPAVLNECKVALELSQKYGTSLHRCNGYYKGEQVDVEKIKTDFYRVGNWGGELRAALGPEDKDFPLLSNEAPKLYSSTGNAPYPAALLREFQTLTQIACENSKRRASSFKGRSIASIAGSGASNTAQDTTVHFLERRCQ
jgi:hypothetical protein